MLKGLALTPPVLGRISIGRVVEKEGKRLPERDDEFTITTQIQGREGWMLHPLNDALRKEGGGKLRSIPVRLLFSDPDLNLRANYTRFDRATGRPVCVGDGESCRRATPDGIRSLPCPGPEACDFGAQGGCRPFGRLNVSIGEEDELGTFVFRTTGFNSIRTLATRLRYFAAVSAGLLAELPLELRLRGKSTHQSHWTPIFFVDLTLRSGTAIPQAIAAARTFREERAAAGFDQQALDDAARQGFGNGAFEESEEEGSALVEEFAPVPARTSPGSATPQPVSLAEKLKDRAGQAANSKTPPPSQPSP